jgi:hypothetical protein
MALRIPAMKPLRWSPAIYLALAIALLLPAAASSQPDSDKRLNREDTVDAIRALSTWFECEECHVNQLAAVTRYGHFIVPSLAATLSGGLSPATRELLRRRLDDRYSQLTEQGKKNPKLAITARREEFVARHLDDFDAKYRIRAAQALTVIGGREARAALEAGLGKTERGDVRAVIGESLKKFK